ncbi:hypothetical protein CAEBREN_06532 [Caenorhabditis brenneri]|uniref:F-box domain-containing protein n=1 Tax=Caenorhabditis brenneri TaxID=135651 RepID=G0MQL1_CAEBE|nr:hypothetical protein CAEBREN_06532 [Caenorhabditis brenneri]
MIDFLSTPLVARANVFDKLEIEDLFSLSERSRSASIAIKQVDWRILDTIIDFDDCRGRSRIQREPQAEQGHGKTVEYELMKKNGNFIPKMKINEREFDIRRLHPDMPSPDAWTNNDFRRWFVRHALRLLCDLFGHLHGVACGMEIEQMRDIMNMRLLRSVVMTDDHVHAHDVTTFCNNFRGRTLLLYPYIFGKLEESTRMMNIPHLYVKNAQWMNRSHLMRFNGKNGFFFETSLRTEDCISFVKRWLYGQDHRLRSIVIRSQHPNAFSEKKVIESFDGVKAWDPKQRQRFYKFEDEWKQNFFREETHLLDGAWGFDLERHDKLLCTMRVTPNAFCLFIWHRRFPSYDKN